MEPFVTRIGDVTIERVLPKSDRGGGPKDFKEVPPSPAAPRRGPAVPAAKESEGIPVNEDLQIFIKPPSDPEFEKPLSDGGSGGECHQPVAAPPKPSEASDMSTDGEETDNEESEMEGDEADLEEKTKHDSDGEMKSTMEEPMHEHVLERTENFGMCGDKEDPVPEGREESANLNLHSDSRGVFPEGELCDSNKRKASDGSSLSPGVGGQKKKKSANDVKDENGSSSDSDDSEGGDSKTMVERKLSNMRRNIREVMSENQLDEETLAAQRQEMERLRRVQEQQRIIREVQRQIAMNRQNNKTQNRVISILQGNSSILKQIPGSSGAGTQVKLPNTVLVKLSSPSSSSSTTTTTNSQGNKKQLIEFLRVQKSLSSGRTISQPGVTRTLVGNKPRGAGQVHMMTPSVSIAPVTSAARQQQDLPSDSDSDEDYESDSDMARAAMRKVAGKPKGKDVVTISSSSDDDCIVLSEPSSGDEEPVDDPTNSGMHTNDMYNIPDEQGRVLVNVGHPADEEDIFIAPQIARVIKPHQIGGVRFLFDNVVESVSRFNTSTGFGCILAHSMGLGKTLQVVCFCDIFLRYTSGRTVLCIMPINTLQNWMAEFNMWLPSDGNCSNSPQAVHADVIHRNFPLHVLNDSHKTMAARARVIKDWSKDGGVLLIGYELYRQLSLKRSSKTKKSKRRKSDELLDVDGGDEKNKALLDDMHTALVKPGPDLVICDEGHRIKNSHASISQALKQIRSKRRVVLTGYPLQNNLLEYWCMVDFVRPNYLGTKTEFCNMFERPIQNGQCIDSTPQDIRLMRYRAHVLHSLLEGFVQRRSHSVLQVSLPQKEEYVLLLRMTQFQRTLYDTFMNEVVRTKAVPNPLKAFAVCCKIWNHPDILYYFLKKRNCGEDVDLDLEEATAATAPGTPVGSASVGSPAKSASMPKKPRGRALKTPQPKKEKKPPAFRQTNSSKKPAATITPNTMNSFNDSANNMPGPNMQYTSPSDQMQTDMGQQNMHVDMQQQDQNFTMMQQQHSYDESQYQNMPGSHYHQGSSNPPYDNQNYGQMSNPGGYNSGNYGSVGQYNSNGSYNNCLDPNNSTSTSGYSSTGNSYYSNNGGNQQSNYVGSVGYSNYPGNGNQSGYHCDASANNTGGGYWQGSDYYSQNPQVHQNPSVGDQYYGGNNSFNGSGNSSYYNNDSYGGQLQGGSYSCQNPRIFQNMETDNSMGCNGSQNFVGNNNTQKSSPGGGGGGHQNNAPAKLDNSNGAHNMKNDKNVANCGNASQHTPNRYHSMNLDPCKSQESSQGDVINADNSMDNHQSTLKNMYSGQSSQGLNPNNLQQSPGNNHASNQRTTPSGQNKLQDVMGNDVISNSNVNMQHNTENVPKKSLCNITNMVSPQPTVTGNSLANAQQNAMNMNAQQNSMNMNVQQNSMNNMNSQLNTISSINGQQNSLNIQQNPVNIMSNQQNALDEQTNPMNSRNAQQNPMNSMNAQQSPMNNMNRQQNPMNIMNPQQQNPMNAQQNPMNPQQNPMNPQQNAMNSQQNPMNPQQQSPMNSSNAQQNPLNTLHTHCNPMSSISTQQNPMAAMNAEQNVVESQQNPMNVSNPQKNHMNTQQNIMNGMNAQQNVMTGMNAQHNSMHSLNNMIPSQNNAINGMIAQQNHINEMLPQQNLINSQQGLINVQHMPVNTVNAQQNPMISMTAEQNSMNNMNSQMNPMSGRHAQQNAVPQNTMNGMNPQQNPINGVNARQNPINGMNAQQNSMNTQQNPINVQQNPMNGMNIQQNSMRGMNSQQNPMNGMNSQQNPMNGMNSQQNPMNGMNSQQNPLNGMNSQQNPMNGMNSQQNPMNGMNSQQNPMNGMNSQQNPMNGMHSQQNPMNGMHSQQNPMNGMNSQLNHMIGVNSQQNTSNTVGPQQNSNSSNVHQGSVNMCAQQNISSQQSPLNSMNPQQGSLNSMNVQQQNLGSSMNLEQNTSNMRVPHNQMNMNMQQHNPINMNIQQTPLNMSSSQTPVNSLTSQMTPMNNFSAQQSTMNSFNAQQNSMNNCSVQQHPMSGMAVQSNPMNSMNVQQNAMNCRNSQQNLMGHSDVQQNAVGILDAQQNSMSSASAQQTCANSMNAQNSVANLSSKHTSRNVEYDCASNQNSQQNPVNFQQTSFNNMNAHQNPVNLNAQQNPMNTNPQRNVTCTNSQPMPLNMTVEQNGNNVGNHQLPLTNMIGHVQHTMNGQQNPLSSINSQQMYMAHMSTTQQLPVNGQNAQQYPMNMNPQQNVGTGSLPTHQNSSPTSQHSHHSISSTENNQQVCGKNMNPLGNSVSDQQSSGMNSMNHQMTNSTNSQENMQHTQHNAGNIPKTSQNCAVGNAAGDKDAVLSSMSNSSYLDNSQTAMNSIHTVMSNTTNNEVDHQNQSGNLSNIQSGIAASVESQRNLYGESVNSYCNNFSSFVNQNTNFGVHNQSVATGNHQNSVDSCNQNHGYQGSIHGENISSNDGVSFDQKGQSSSDSKPPLPWDPNKHHYNLTDSKDVMKCEPNVNHNSELKSSITSVMDLTEAEKKLDSIGKTSIPEFETCANGESKYHSPEFKEISPMKLETDSATVKSDESNSTDEEKKNLRLLNEVDKETADAQNQANCTDAFKSDCETKEASTGMYLDSAKMACLAEGKQLVEVGTNPARNNDPGIPYDWATELLKNYVPGSIENSAKMEVFFCILEESMALGDRLLVFSQSLFTLNLIEDFLQRSNVPGQQENWARNVNYYRLDGSTSALEREKLINEYNSNPNIHLFLVSTRAGSLGINLVGANRVVVFDASWNPCHDTQAVCRVYRYGQKKPCFVYRLVMDNCLEKKIYDRQINKQGMADRVVDECNPDAHLSIKDVTNLCWDKEEDTEVKDFSKEKDKYIDVVMQKVLDKFSSCLSKEPFQHESLLVDRKEKKLSQAEKRLAKRSYELEKQASINYNRPQYSYYPAGVGTTGVQSGLQIRAIRTDGGGGVMPKPVASVRPMQAELNSQLERGPGGQPRSTITTLNTGRSRWIPAEVWQRQGMSAQEMTLPLDVVIPTNSPDRASIVLKAGQRVMVLKSPKGIYMQLENGKIIAIRTAFKVGGAGKGSNAQEKSVMEKEGEIKPSDLKKDFNISSGAATRTNTKVSNVLPFKNNSAITIIPKTTTMTPGRTTPSRPANKMITINRQETGLKPWNSTSNSETQGKMNLLAKQRLMGAKMSQQPTGEARPYFHQQQGLRNKKMAVGGNQLTGMAKPFFHQDFQRNKMGTGMSSLNVRNHNIPPSNSDDTSSGAENVISVNDDRDDAVMRDVDSEKYQSMDFQDTGKYSRVPDDVEQDSEMSSEDAMPLGKDDGNFTCTSEEYSSRVRQDEQCSVTNFQSLREKPAWQHGEKQAWQQGEKPAWQQGEKSTWQQGEKQGWQQGEKSSWQQDEKPGRQQGEKSSWQKGEKQGWQQGEKQGWQQGEKQGWQQGEKQGWQQGEKQGWQQGEKQGWQQGEKQGWQQGEKQAWQQGEKQGWQQGEKQGWQQGEKQGWQQGEKQGWQQGEKQGWQQGEKQGWQQGEKQAWQQGEKPGWQKGEKHNWQKGEKHNWQQGEKPTWPQDEKQGWQQGEKHCWKQEKTSWKQEEKPVGPQGEKRDWQQEEKQGWSQGEKRNWQQGGKSDWQQGSDSHNFDVESKHYQIEDKNWDDSVRQNIEPVQNFQSNNSKSNFTSEKLDWQDKTKPQVSNKITNRNFVAGNRSDGDDKWTSSSSLSQNDHNRNWHTHLHDDHKKGGYMTDSSVGDSSNEWQTAHAQGPPGSYANNGRHFTQECLDWKVDSDKQNSKFPDVGDYAHRTSSQNRKWPDQRNECQNIQDMSTKNLGKRGEIVKGNEGRNFQFDGGKLQKRTTEDQNFSPVNFGDSLNTPEPRQSDLKSGSSSQTRGKEFLRGAVTVQKMESALPSPMRKDNQNSTTSLKNYRHTTFTQNTHCREVDSCLDKNTAAASSTSVDSPPSDRAVRPPSYGNEQYTRSPLATQEANKEMGATPNASYTYESRLHPDSMIRKVTESSVNSSEDNSKMKQIPKMDPPYDFSQVMSEGGHGRENMGRLAAQQSQQHANMATTQPPSSTPSGKKGRGTKSSKQDGRSATNFSLGYDIENRATNLTSQAQLKQVQNKPVVTSESLTHTNALTANPIPEHRSPQEPSKSPETYSNPGYSHHFLGAPGYYGYGHQGPSPMIPFGTSYPVDPAINQHYEKPMQVQNAHVQDKSRSSENAHEDKGKSPEVPSSARKDSGKSSDARDSKKESKPSQASSKEDAKSVASPGSASGSRSGNNSARSTPALPPSSSADSAPSQTSPAPPNFSPFSGSAPTSSVSQNPYDSVLSSYPSSSQYNLSAPGAGAAPSPFAAPAGTYGAPLRPPPTANSVSPYGAPGAYGYGTTPAGQYDSEYARASMYSAFHRPEPHHFPAPPADLGSPFLASANPSPFSLPPHHTAPAFAANPGANPTSNFYPQNMYAANPYTARPAYGPGDPSYGVPYGTPAAGFSPFLNHLPGAMHQHPYAALPHPGSTAPLPAAAPAPSSAPPATERPAQ